MPFDFAKIRAVSTSQAQKSRLTTRYSWRFRAMIAERTIYIWLTNFIGQYQCCVRERNWGQWSSLMDRRGSCMATKWAGLALIASANETWSDLAWETTRDVGTTPDLYFQLTDIPQRVTTNKRSAWPSGARTLECRAIKIGLPILIREVCAPQIVLESTVQKGSGFLRISELGTCSRCVFLRQWVR